jgi:ABC-type nitrate/sulfonate/bicarbonate transport system substrate-binding protein
MRGFLAVAALAALAVSPAVTPAQAQTEVAMISFGGATNLPVWIALDRGMFEKNGLKVAAMKLVLLEQGLPQEFTIKLQLMNMAE